MSVAPQSVSLFDSRPFFEKALTHGIEHGLIGQDKLDAIRADAPKGMVQIARYFGTEYLRPELELARDRIVNLVSLHLAHSTEGDLHRAAELWLGRPLWDHKWCAGAWAPALFFP